MACNRVPRSSSASPSSTGARTPPPRAGRDGAGRARRRGPTGAAGRRRDRSSQPASWRYRDPGLSRRSGSAPRRSDTNRSRRGHPAVARQPGLATIAHGPAVVVLLAGAETWRTRKRLKPRASGRTGRARTTPSRSGRAPRTTCRCRARPRNGSDCCALGRLPAVRAGAAVAGNESGDEHRRRIGELWAGSARWPPTTRTPGAARPARRGDRHPARTTA